MRPTVIKAAPRKNQIDDLMDKIKELKRRHERMKEDPPPSTEPSPLAHSSLPTSPLQVGNGNNFSVENIEEFVRKLMEEEEMRRSAKAEQSYRIAVRAERPCIKEPTVNSFKANKEGRYECMHCGYITNRKLLLEQHLETDHNMLRLYQCLHCKYRVRLLSHLKSHVNKFHKKEKTMYCAHCEYGATLKPQLVRHINKFHPRYAADKIPRLVKRADTSQINTVIRWNKKEKKLGCVECEFTTSNKTLLVQHIHTFHDAQKSCQCGLCDLDSRLHTQPDSVDNYNRCFLCDQCEFKTDTTVLLKRHIESVHNKSKPFACPHCDFTAPRKNSITIHLDTFHKNDKPLKCIQCKFKTTQKSTLTRHVNEFHNKVREFECPHCQHKFNRQLTLNNHIESVHKKKKPFQCSRCDYSSGWKKNLFQHINVVHNEPGPFYCRQCDYVGETKPMIRIHMIASHPVIPEVVKPKPPRRKYKLGRPPKVAKAPTIEVVDRSKKKKPYQCDQCEYRASQKTRLKDHQELIHATSFKKYIQNNEQLLKCPLCNYSTRKKTTLLSHIYKLHSLDKCFKCAHCNYGTDYRGDLKEHFKADHPVEKPSDPRPTIRQFHCDQCPYKAYQYCHLKRHQDSVHNKVKPYVCSLCNYKAGRKSHLQKHVATIHGTTLGDQIIIDLT